MNRAGSWLSPEGGRTHREAGPCARLFMLLLVGKQAWVGNASHPIRLPFAAFVLYRSVCGIHYVASLKLIGGTWRRSKRPLRPRRMRKRLTRPKEHLGIDGYGSYFLSLALGYMACSQTVPLFLLMLRSFPPMSSASPTSFSLGTTKIGRGKDFGRRRRKATLTSAI